MNQDNLESKEPGGKMKRFQGLRRRFPVILLSVVVLGAGVWIGKNLQKEPGDVPSGGVMLDANAGTYEEPEKKDDSTPGVAIPGWGSLTLPANTTDVPVDFYNPEENQDLYYLTFEVRLPDASERGYEVLYESGLVAPGLHIQNIQLAHGLDAGTYNAVIHVQPYRIDEAKTPTNNADMNTELIIQ